MLTDDLTIINQLQQILKDISVVQNIKEVNHKMKLNYN